jgi:AcrR family transcriptional regulator
MPFGARNPALGATNHLGSHNGEVPTDREQAGRPDGSTQRQNILRTALSLMGQQGVDGTSMRTLAAATGLNVASLYHYFPSKRDLLVAVLEERGLVENVAQPSLSRDPATDLADLLHDILQSMLEVEDFIRLMLGEVMRGDETASTVGTELFDATQASLEHWLGEHGPPLCPPGAEAAMARVLRSLLVGLFVEHVAGVLGGEDAGSAFRMRADEVSALLERAGTDDHRGR